MLLDPKAEFIAIAETIIEKDIPERTIIVPASIERPTWRWNMGSEYAPIQPGQVVTVTMFVDGKEIVTMTHEVEKGIPEGMELRPQLAYMPLTIAGMKSESIKE